MRRVAAAVAPLCVGAAGTLAGITSGTPYEVRLGLAPDEVWARWRCAPVR